VDAAESIWGERRTEHVEWLSEHAVRGERWDKALTYLQQAGEKAYAFSAHREAVAYREKALTCIEHLPSTRALVDAGIELHIQLRNSLTQLGEKTRQGEHLREAQRLAETVNDQKRLAQVASLLANYFLTVGEMQQAIGSSQRAFALVSSLNEFDLRVMINVHLAQIEYTCGRFRNAARHLHENIASIPPDRHHECFDLAVPASVLSRSFCSYCLGELGEFEEGIALGLEAVRLAERFDRMLDCVYAYRGVASAYMRKGDCVAALPLLERGLQICRAGNFPPFLTPFASMLGYVRAVDGLSEDALPLLEEVTNVPAYPNNAWYALWAGAAYLKLGRVEEAERIAQRTLTISRLQGSAKFRGMVSASALRNSSRGRFHRFGCGARLQPASHRLRGGARHAPAHCALPLCAGQDHVCERPEGPGAN
jgi:tetratricopeptide (TPR) repeat protein